jgi:hypothetical protein
MTSYEATTISPANPANTYNTTSYTDPVTLLHQMIHHMINHVCQLVTDDVLSQVEGTKETDHLAVEKQATRLIEYTASLSHLLPTEEQYKHHWPSHALLRAAALCAKLADQRIFYRHVWRKRREICVLAAQQSMLQAAKQLATRRAGQSSSSHSSTQSQTVCIDIVDIAGIHRQSTHTPISDVMLIYANYLLRPHPADELSGRIHAKGPFVASVAIMMYIMFSASICTSSGDR